MSASLRRLLVWLALILLMAFLGNAVMAIWHSHDVEAENSREYVLSNEDVRTATGGVKEIIFRKKLSYNGSGSDPSYVEFNYRINGSDNDVSVVVRGYGDPLEYSLKEMRDL